MKIATIGTIRELVKIQRLEFKKNERLKNPFMEKGDAFEMGMGAVYKNSYEESYNKNMISGIDSKMKSGKRLSPTELAYLRRNSPELYRQAMLLEQERENYKRALKRCKTKEDVKRLRASSVCQLVGEINTIKGQSGIGGDIKLEQMETILKRSMTLNDEHIAFIKSKDYAALPSELEKSKKARRQRLRSNLMRLRREIEERRIEELYDKRKMQELKDERLFLDEASLKKGLEDEKASGDEDNEIKIDNPANDISVSAREEVLQINITQEVEAYAPEQKEKTVYSDAKISIKANPYEKQAMQSGSEGKISLKA